MNKKLKAIVVVAAVAALTVMWLGRKPEGVARDVEWGVSFSKIFASQLGLDWRETFLAILDDLGAKSMRLPVYWHEAEPEKDKYAFADYDWMIQETKKRNIKLILVVGERQPRWPECHLPDWAEKLSPESRQSATLDFVEQTVGRYRNSENLYAWQVENEPFLMFGECPKFNARFLNKEIEKVRALDSGHPILVTDSGEFGWWLSAAKRADVFGTTMYRIVWNKYTGYLKYPLPPRFFWLKANLIRIFNAKKPIIVSELQAEPWGPKAIYEMSRAESDKSMSLEQFRDNIEYARRVGFGEAYLWGVEWWYWLKTKQNDSRFWDTAQQIIATSDKQ